MEKQAFMWNVEYLLPFAKTADAVPDPRSPGWFTHKSVVAAPSKSDVLKYLATQGGVPLTVETVKPVHPWFAKVSRDYKQQFLIAIAYNVDAGMSATKALAAVAESTSGHARSTMERALATLDLGSSFVEAVSALDWFDETTLTLMVAGERTGGLPAAIRSAAAHFGESSIAMKVMYGAVSATVLDLLFAASSIIGVKGYLQSVDTSKFKSENPEAIANFLFQIKLATVMANVMFYLTLLATGFVVVALYGYLGTNTGFRDKVDRWVRRVPYLRASIQHNAMAATTLVAASLLSGGTGVRKAIELVVKSTRVPEVLRYWQDAIVKLDSGDSTSKALSRSPLDSSERLIIGAHASQPQLANAFSRIAVRRKDLAKSQAKKFGLFMLLLSMAYSGVSVLQLTWVVYLQYKPAMGM